MVNSPISNDAEDPIRRGARFRAARLARGIGQAELGRRVGATQSLIGQVECGRILRSKYETLIMFELGIPLDPETERWILASRQSGAGAGGRRSAARWRAGRARPGAAGCGGAGRTCRDCARSGSACPGKVGTGFPKRACANKATVRGRRERGRAAAAARHRLPVLRRRAPAHPQQGRRHRAARVQPRAAPHPCRARGAARGHRQGARAHPQGPPAGLLHLCGRPLLPPRHPRARAQGVHPLARGAGHQEPVRDGRALSRQLAGAAGDRRGQCQRALFRRARFRLQGRHRRHPRRRALRHPAAPARLRGGVLAACADPRRRRAAGGARRGRHRGDPGSRPPTASATCSTRCGATPRPA